MSREVPLKSAIPYQAVNYANLTVMSFNDERDDVRWLPALGVVHARHRGGRGEVIVPVTNIYSMVPVEPFQADATPASTPSKAK